MNVTAINPQSNGTLGHYAAAAIPLSECRSSPSRHTCFIVIFCLIGSLGDDLGSDCVQPKEELSRGTAGKLVNPVRVAYKGLEEGVPAVPTQVTG
jgi:hypothetical protein